MVNFYLHSSLAYYGIKNEWAFRSIWERQQIISTNAIEKEDYKKSYKKLYLDVFSTLENIHALSL